MYIESLLSGQPQYIIASINLLITIAVSRYLIHLEKLTAERIHRIESDGKIRDMTRYKVNWHILLMAWWMLAGVAMVTLLLRIIPSMFYRDEAELHHPWFILMDLIIVTGTFIGYALLATISFRAWKWNDWQGKSEPGI